MPKGFFIMVSANEKLIQLTIAPLEYTIFMNQKKDKKRAYRVDDGYWKQLPTYLIARCPLCKTPYKAKIDPHSCSGWDTISSASGRIFYSEKHENAKCEHHVTVQKFTNFHSEKPLEFGGFRNDLHVPFVMPFFVPDDISSFAVIHSFKICRLEDKNKRVYNYKVHAFEEKLKKYRFRDRRDITDRSAEDTAALKKAVFVPRYTAYAVTYYSADPQELIRRRVDSEKEYGADDPEYEPLFLASMGEMKRTPYAYDLAYWVEQKKLQWLDLESPDLPLKSGPVEDFPYVNIQDDSGISNRCISKKLRRRLNWVEGNKANILNG